MINVIDPVMNEVVVAIQEAEANGTEIVIDICINVGLRPTLVHDEFFPEVAFYQKTMEICDAERGECFKFVINLDSKITYDEDEDEYVIGDSDDYWVRIKV